MESVGKQASSDSSSDENDRLEQVKEDTSTTKRSYECTFCKRGFTNAQALGGHMNIHRKDRAKAKQITVPLFSSKPTVGLAMNEDYMNPGYTAPISGEAAAKYYPALEAQRNYLMYYQPSVSNPRHPHALHDSEFLHSKSQSLSTSEELLGANLSLGIGSTCVEDNQVRRGIMKDDELDLELRLGNNP